MPSTDILSLLIYLLILLFSVILHEIAHGLVAERLGDPTAREAGRLTLNPIPHIDLFGSILLPAFLLLIHSPILFGSAKPVPVDYRNFKNLKWDMILVSLAGIATNFAIAIVAALIFRLMPNISSFAQGILIETVSLNVILGLFNLVPIPPLDGSKVLASLFGYLDRGWMYAMLSLERYGFIILVVLLYTGAVQFVLLPPLTFLLKFFLGPGVNLGM